MKRPEGARTIYVQPALWQRIKVHCVSIGMSVSRWIRELAQRELDKSDAGDGESSPSP